MTEANARNRERHVLSGTRGSGNFDVRSWQGLTSVLKAGRDAGMDTDTYSKFRDTVLQYAQSRGTDKDLRAQIETVLASFGETVPKVEEPVVETESVAVETPPKKVESPQKTSFGSGRPSPQFSVPVSAPKEKQQPQPPKVQHEAPENLPIHTDVPIRKVVPAPQPEEVAPARAQDDTKTISDYKARIDQIKHTVNAEIGNPTALLSEANEVGRAYMQALVAAMKAVSGAAPGTLSSSMQKLEELFPKVLETAKNHEKGKAAPMQKPVVEAERPVEKPAVVEPIPDAPPQIEKTPVPEPTAEVVEPVEEEPEEETPEIVIEEKPLPKVTPKPEPTPVVTVPHREVEDVPVAPKKILALPSLRDQLAKQDTLRKEEVPLMVEPEESPKAVPKPMAAPVMVTPKNLPVPEKEMEVKEDKKEGNSEPIPEPTSNVPTQAPAAQAVETRRGPLRPTSEVRTSTTEQQLDTPEIDAGLSEILNTWKLFRGGGIFGIKKAGLENPLYQKLKDEPMSVVATGRWDGADQEAILSMRDYISGWRQEQGMWYVPSETFENYLRRVVRRVLKRQQNG